MHLLARVIIAVAVLLVLIVGAVHLLTAPWFITWEYRRPGFPDDPYGMEPDVRLQLAKATVAFLNLPRDLDLLRVLRLPDGEPAYTGRELAHMNDVKRVYDGLTWAALIAGVAALLAGWWLQRHVGVAAVWGALSEGGLVTLLLLIFLGAWMFLSWDSFFIAMHQVFFREGTWTFSYSDTLIRLFPGRFWEDAGMYVALIVAGSAFLIALCGRVIAHRLNRISSSS